MARHGGAGQAGQTHKVHKGGRKRHRNNDEAPRRMGIKQNTANRHGNNVQGTRRARLQAAKSHREKLREKTLREKRLSTHGPPKVIAIIPCTDQVNLEEAHELLRTAATVGARMEDNNGDAFMGTKVEHSGEETFCVPDVKVRVRILPPFQRASERGALRSATLIRLLDYIKIADIVLFVTKAGGSGKEEEAEVMDPLALSMCEALRAFSLPNVYCCVQGMAGLGLSEKAREKKRATKVFTEQVRDSVNCLPLDSNQDCLHLFRMLKEHKQIVPVWRKQRPYLITEGCEVFPNGNQVRVSLTGYVRGQNLSANQAFLLPGIGEYHVERIDQEDDPFTKARKKGKAEGASLMDEDTKTLVVADKSQLESLARENVPDPLAGEQTWPTEEEMREAEEMQLQATKTHRLSSRSVPKGFSEYQSAWIDEEDDDFSDEMEFEDTTDEEDEGNDPGASHFKHPADNLGDHHGEIEIMSEDEGDVGEEEDEYENMDDYVDNYERERKSRKDAEDEDLEFPDEVEVPLDKPARERFLKYRGLKSFRTSPWDPKESLPMEYAKIYAFENPVKAQKQAKAKLRAPAAGFASRRPDLVTKGEHVKLVFTGIPPEKAEALLQAFQGSRGSTPYVIFGLLQHETKMSMVNFAVHKSSSYEEPLANKDDLVFYTGIRMFRGRPIISDSAPNVDKHKNQKFMRSGESCTFSLYAPIHHAPLPVLCFKETEAGLSLVAAGLVKSVDPDRIVLKRIILTGYPYKVHKAKAYVRYMFHSPEDVRWFSPLEVWTKYGRRGKIREAVGTHGTMKCMFDAVVQQRDTVCISLYKRVFPKWQDDETFVM
ncbi:ribosome biogenesis protein BMS1/TSR1 [Chloropicon primus]|uniref:Ribosome biogenesis protein BMS1/TSR1 n=2 Tax=Chloropicon primus TaxID=1764295 RepID=A0A5B8MT42_9CHLO|nr:ribosome biogenesis protein BMS1/TSR1 [Chloropicon primus]|eukprot:QDZ23541.1 ribosome biogenesis protein BMS1/TSR1 [Chloropicon primus]